VIQPGEANQLGQSKNLSHVEPYYHYRHRVERQENKGKVRLHRYICYIAIYASSASGGHLSESLEKACNQTKKALEQLREKG